MKCKKCGAELQEKCNNCPMCGKKLRSKKPLVLSLISIILAVLIVLSSGTVAFSLFNTELKKENSVGNSTVQEETAEEELPQADLTKKPTIRVQIDDDYCFVGQESTVGFRAYLSKKVDSVRLFRTDNNAEITELTVATQPENGTWEYSGEYTFTPDTAGKINFRAYAGEEFSEETYIFVASPFTEEEQAEFDEISTGLAAYMESLDTMEMEISEILAEAEEWLNNHDSVAEVIVSDNEVTYKTDSGIYSSFLVDSGDDFFIGEDSAMGDFKENTTAVEYFNEWKTDESALTTIGSISYLSSDITITNDQTLIVMPTKYSNDGFDDPFFDEFDDVIYDSPKINSRPVICDTPWEVMDSIMNREWARYGTVYLCAHGGNDDNYFFGIFDSTDESEYLRFKDDYDFLMNSEAAPNDFSIHYQEVLKDNEIHYEALLSSRFIMKAFRGFEFDNTFFFMVSCHGFVDDEFNAFLLSNKAQGILGSDNSILFLSAFSLFNDVIKPMYYNEGNDESKLSNTFSAGADGGAVTISIENDYLGVSQYYLKSKEHVQESQRISLSRLMEIYPHSIITDADRIAEYYQWVIGSKLTDIDVITYNERVELADGEVRFADHYDAVLTVDENFEYITRESDFTFGGDGSITGTLYNGTVTRTIYSDGSYKDVNNKGEILTDTEITAYRFLNQRFNEELTVKSGKDGKFTFKAEDDDVFPWGHYVIASKDDNYDGEASIILTQHATNGGDLVLHGGKSTLSGIVQGEKSATDKSLIVLSEANVSLIDSKGNTVASTSVGSDGSFTFKDIEKGTYTLSITCKDYEKLTMSVEIEKGFVYQYTLGCIVLQPLDSIMDVVLVLDTSGSMSGEPIAATRDAASRFANTVLGADKSCRVGVVTYASGSSTACSFTKYSTTVEPIVSRIGAGGGTNISSGLSTAESMLSDSEARNKIIILMSDGLPNEGKIGDSLVSYADEIKKDGIIIYTIGFFSGISDEQTRNECRSLMGRLASKGYHFEGTSIGELSAFFNDMALMASDKSMIHLEIACPVDVKVSYNGETLSSAADSLCTRTSFGTLMFDGDEDDPTKIVRLSEDVDFTVEIIGTGKGTMDYSISYVDENGNYTDTRTFKKVPVTKKFTAVTTTAKEDITTMKVDSDGDGKIDLVYENAGKKETTVTDAKQFAEKVMKITAIVLAAIFGVVIIIIIIAKAVPAIKRLKKKKAEKKANAPDVKNAVSYIGKKKIRTPKVQQPLFRFCADCGERLSAEITFCGKCGRAQHGTDSVGAVNNASSAGKAAFAVSVKQELYPKKTDEADSDSLAFCPECGEKLEAGVIFCGNCGKPLKN